MTKRKAPIFDLQYDLLCLMRTTPRTVLSLRPIPSLHPQSLFLFDSVMFSAGMFKRNKKKKLTLCLYVSTCLLSLTRRSLSSCFDSLDAASVAYPIDSRDLSIYLLCMYNSQKREAI